MLKGPRHIFLGGKFCWNYLLIVIKIQVQIGAHSFTFDHVYGSTGSPSSDMFEECVAPLVDGLFQGYNATVLAYGQVKLLIRVKIVKFLYTYFYSAWSVTFSLDWLQTGSGKTYTMGTGFKDGCQTGIIPQVMNVLFGKIEALQHQIEFQLHVSFIEVCCQFFCSLIFEVSLYLNFWS